MMEELDEDIREHIAQETQNNIERGMSPEEARRDARAVSIPLLSIENA